MKKQRRAWGDASTDASPYGYLSARWRPERGWHDVVLSGEVSAHAVEALGRHGAAVELTCRLFGAAGLEMVLAPNRPTPAYWLDSNAGISAPSSMLVGCLAPGADVIRCEVLGVPARDWTAAMEGRARSLLVDLHAAVAAPLVAHG